MKIFEIKYKQNKKINKIDCTSLSIDRYKNNIENNLKGKIISINEKMNKRNTRNTHKSNIKNKKMMCLYGKIRTEKRRLCSGKITKEEFLYRVQLLKDLSRNCKTSEALKNKYKNAIK